MTEPWEEVSSDPLENLRTWVRFCGKHRPDVVKVLRVTQCLWDQCKQEEFDLEGEAQLYGFDKVEIYDDY